MSPQGLFTAGNIPGAFLISAMQNNIIGQTIVNIVQFTPGDFLRVEAENLTLNTYKIEPNTKASNNALISLRGGNPLESGSAFDTFNGTTGGIGTGLLRNWVRSKLGIYRGLGRKKILSGVMAANPEILAYSEVDPTQDAESLMHWNDLRGGYDRGYYARPHEFSVNPASGPGVRFWQSIALDATLKVTQKAAEAYLNPMLPKGVNF